jgi:hypothetical protein
MMPCLVKPPRVRVNPQDNTVSYRINRILLSEMLLVYVITLGEEGCSYLPLIRVLQGLVLTAGFNSRSVASSVADYYT